MSTKRPASEPRQVVVSIFGGREGRSIASDQAATESGEASRRPARVAHMLALAIRVEKMIASGELKDRAPPPRTSASAVHA